ncbi:PfkB family carbohydrate kinase [Variovorax sp. V15]|uniref:PfkB family carbohydrate kinase n=1 Tax=Variovorax sp. V15 TaxID=3065952 RepID=UPI0034E86B9D
MTDPLVVVGGVYEERCLHPSWQQYYGSGGRAASAIAKMGAQVKLYTRLDPAGRQELEERAALENFTFHAEHMEDPVRFEYHHPLETPRIEGAYPKQSSLHVEAEAVVQFGMIEGDAVVKADRVVYDPQNAEETQHFVANGSQARELALILNRREARQLSGMTVSATADEMAKKLLQDTGARVVVIKEGPLGAYVLADKTDMRIPAYRSRKVWKIGSGDNFVAHFGYQWLVQREPAAKCVELAARATAYYCQAQEFVSPSILAKFKPEEINVKESIIKGRHQPNIYLAGPFFTLNQLWMVKQARADLRGLGLEVFSPVHDVGHGTAEEVVEPDLEAIKAADVVFAIVDGMDPGTVYEIGYAKALNKPVVVYSENETDDNLTMMVGSGCIIRNDYATAIYETVWEAVRK